jgi:putative ABC transport system permease protein
MIRRTALALYRVVAQALLPRGFLAEYGKDLVAAVGERMGSRGMLGVLGTLGAELFDLARTAVRERWGPVLPGSELVEVGSRREGGIREVTRDLRAGARHLKRRPGLALAATLTIGLGIGATTTTYGVVDSVVLRPLPYANPGALVAIGALTAEATSVDAATGVQELAPVSSVEVDALRETSRSFESLAAMYPYRVLVSDDDGVEQFVDGVRVSADFFEILGVSPSLGRFFLPEEFPIEQTNAVVISHSFWQTRYGGDASVVGQPFEWWASSAGVRPTIVGVLPPDFRPPEAFFAEDGLPEIYAPLTATWPPPVMALLTGLSVIGRLDAGTTVTQARNELQAIAVELAQFAAEIRVPGGRARAIGVNDLHAQTVGNAGRTLWVFLAAAALLLLLTVMNAAMLVLVRGLDRRQELGVRLALGGERLHVVRLLLGEAALLTVGGGVLGVLMAYGGVEAFLRFAPPSIPLLSTVTVDTRVLAVAALSTIVIGVGAGLLPALLLTRQGVLGGLQAGGRSVSEPASQLRMALVGGQLALAMVLLCGAGLLFTSFVRVRGADPGFDPDGLVVMSPLAARPPRLVGDQARTFYRRWDPVLAVQASVPGVASVAGASGIPFQPPKWAPVLTLEGDTPETVRTGIAGYAVTPGFLETLGVEVLRGRTIASYDRADAERVAVVNEEFVRTQLGRGEAVGTLVRRVLTAVRSPDPVTMRIVGVVGNVVQTRTEDGPRPAIYIPYTQADNVQLGEWWAVARTTLPADVIVPALRASLDGSEVHPEGVGTMAERIAVTHITPRFQAMLIGAFAGVALLLAAVGLHGSLAHMVRTRQRELGLRMALGADRSAVIGMVMRKGMTLAVVGLTVGLVGALALTRVIASFLYGIQPYGPLTLTSVALVLLIVCGLACLLPARRATALDPVRVLQGD